MPVTLGTLFIAVLLALYNRVSWFLTGLLTWDRSKEKFVKAAKKEKKSNLPLPETPAKVSKGPGYGRNYTVNLFRRKQKSVSRTDV